MSAAPPVNGTTYHGACSEQVIDVAWTAEASEKVQASNIHALWEEWSLQHGICAESR